MERLIDLSYSRRIHMVGIGGAGMSAIAKVLVSHGHTISGSDQSTSSVIGDLSDLGVLVSVGHQGQNVGDAEIVARSTAIGDDNPEVAWARSNGIEVLSRSQLLGPITDQYRTLAISGTHGKTTTTALVALGLLEAGLDPSYIIGGNVLSLGGGAGTGSSDILVVEADESDGTFCNLTTTGVIVTNIEQDHLEFYGTFEHLKGSFRQFALNSSGPKVVCLDDKYASELAAEVSDSITYGEGPDADYRLVNIRSSSKGCEFQIVADGGTHPVSLKFPGVHNCLNATAAFALCSELGVEAEPLLAAIESYEGVGRRFQHRGETSQITFVDDYAHLPTEVAAAVGAARSTNPKRLVAVFQPHRYSRTQEVWEQFGPCFEGVDQLVLADVYGAGEDPRPNISGELIVSRALAHLDSSKVHYVASRAHLPQFLADFLESGDLCLTMGAGDITDVPDETISVIESGANS